jgi:hypothetical protein
VGNAIIEGYESVSDTLKSAQREEPLVEFGTVNIGVKAENEDDLLRQCGLLTDQMRDHQLAISMLNDQRRRIVRQLRVFRVPYRKIANSAGVSDQALYADLRKHPVEETAK